MKNAVEDFVVNTTESLKQPETKQKIKKGVKKALWIWIAIFCSPMVLAAIGGLIYFIIFMVSSRSMPSFNPPF